MVIIDKVMTPYKVNINKRTTGVDDVYIWDGVSNLNFRVNASQHIGREAIMSMAGKKIRVKMELVDDDIPPRPSKPAPSANTPSCKGACNKK